MAAPKKSGLQLYPHLVNPPPAEGTISAAPVIYDSNQQTAQAASNGGKKKPKDGTVLN